MNLVIKCVINFFLVVCLLKTGCQLQGKESAISDKKDITVRDLYRAARKERKILIVDGWGDQHYNQKLRQLADNSHMSNWQLIVKDQHEVTEEEMASIPTMLIGTPTQNKWVKYLMAHLPIGIDNHKITHADQAFDANSHALIYSYYPNPLNVRMPVGLFTSENETLIWELTNKRIASFVRGNWGYEILRGDRRVLLGNLSQRVENRWEVDRDKQLHLPSSIKHHWETGPFVFKSCSEQLNPETLQPITDRLLAAYQRMAAFCGNELTSKIDYYLYPSTEIKGLITGNTDQSHMIYQQNQVHTAFDDHFAERYHGKENELIIENMLGQSSHAALKTGLSLYFGDTWEEKGYGYWSKYLIQQDNGMTVNQLLDDDFYMGASSLIREALAGSLVHFLIDKLGKEAFLALYNSWQPGKTEMDQLNVEWHKWVQSKEMEIDFGGKRSTPYLQGFNFTHEGYQIFNGYGSSMSQQSLERVRSLGSNAVAIVPYSWMRDPKTPARFRFSDRAGSENDEGVVHALCEANKQGLFTVLKPHVWISGSWPGEVSMQDDKAWEQFFEHYYQWIRHYAFMAEIYQADMLCIGVEFSQATLNQSERWSELIGRIRKIYHGNLTYAANWGDEFENIKFWDQLDVIGLNCYYPLSENRTASEKELIAGFSKVLSKVNQVKSRYNKPVVLTEIGFRSVESPWLQPHEEAFDKKYSQEHQALAYSAVFNAMDTQPVADGILWWKWPTNMGNTLEEDRRFIPAGKSSERVIEHWFKRRIVE